MDVVLTRNPADAATHRFDVIVVGGGIQGACVMLEAARRGLRVLLLEQQDFGHATSWNSLRIIHGGLRYLQTCDLLRYRESVREQAWWLRHFPELVRPLPCLLPLDGRGLRRPWLMRAASILHNSWARRIRYGGSSARRQIESAAVACGAAHSPSDFAGDDDRGLNDVARELHDAAVIDQAATRARCPALQGADLCGGLLWSDAVIVSPQRLLMEVLRWGVACGATVLNYVQAGSLTVEHDQVRGLLATCQMTKETYQFAAPQVVNCAGPWTNELASHFDRRFSPSRGLALAFNLLVDRPLPDPETAIAVRSSVAGAAHTYFLVPRGRQTLLGTVHTRWEPPALSSPAVPSEMVAATMQAIQAALPDWHLSAADLLQVHAGLLPSRKGIHPDRRPEFVCHARAGGARGLFSVHGVKFTTARAVAERVMQLICEGKPPTYGPGARPPMLPCLSLMKGQGMDAVAGDPLSLRELISLIERESVQHLDDLLLRRVDGALESSRLLDVARQLTLLLGWDHERCQVEFERLQKRLLAYQPSRLTKPSA